MEQKTSCRYMSIPLIVFCYAILLTLSTSSSSAVEAYKNYTVGDSLGWYDNLEKPTVNYQKWVAGKIFSLGDFLIFNSDNNHSVIQTYNFTTYKSCDFNDADTDDTTRWAAADPSSTAIDPVSIAVPLLKEGMTYFFSGDYDGEQCKHGQRFKINVTHGAGLPASLKSPSTEAPGPTSPDDEDSTPTPDTVVSSNFNHPKDHSGDEDDNGDAVKKTSDSVSLTKLNFNLVVGLLGFVWIFF